MLTLADTTIRWGKALGLDANSLDLVRHGVLVREKPVNVAGEIIPGTPNSHNLQNQLDRFRKHCDGQRPHRARDRNIPGTAYRAAPKALPAADWNPEHYRLRYDRVDSDGHVRIRCASKMHHLGICRTYTGDRVLALIDDTTVTLIQLETGEILSEHIIDPTRDYWRNQRKKPGQWPDSQK